MIRYFGVYFSLISIINEGRCERVFISAASFLFRHPPSVVEIFIPFKVTLGADRGFDDFQLGEGFLRGKRAAISRNL